MDLIFKPLKRKVRDHFRKEFIESTLIPYISSGHISLRESRFLMEIVRCADVNKGPLIEIGTLFGYSTMIIVLTKNPQKVLYTVDNFRWNPAALSKAVHQRITLLHLKEAVKNENVRMIAQNKRAFYAQYNDDIPSLIFVDADHSYEGTKEDLLWAKVAGIKYVCGHDYCRNHEPVVQAVHDVFQRKPSKVIDSLFVM